MLASQTVPRPGPAELATHPVGLEGVASLLDEHFGLLARARNYAALLRGRVSVQEELGLGQDGTNGGGAEGDAGGSVEEDSPRVVAGNDVKIQDLDERVSASARWTRC